MARVLMERNQYKEKLIELQDALKFTEIQRAKKMNNYQNTSKTGIWDLYVFYFKFLFYCICILKILAFLIFLGIVALHKLNDQLEKQLQFQIKNPKLLKGRLFPEILILIWIGIVFELNFILKYYKSK